MLRDLNKMPIAGLLVTANMGLSGEPETFIMA